MDTPYLRAKSLRPKSEKELQYEKIAQECGEAWLALKEGRPHPRINTKTPEQRKRELVTYRCASEAAFYPELPTILVTTPDSDEWNDYRTVRHGFGGAIRQE